MITMVGGGHIPHKKRNSASHSQNSQYKYRRSSGSNTQNLRLKNRTSGSSPLGPEIFRASGPITPIKLKNRYSSKETSNLPYISGNTPIEHHYHLANNTSNQHATHQNDIMEEDMNNMKNNDSISDGNHSNDSNEDEYKLYGVMDINSDLQDRSDLYDPTLEQLENYEHNKMEAKEERMAYCKYLKTREIWILLIIFVVICVVCYFIIHAMEMESKVFYAITILICIIILWIMHICLLYFYDKKMFASLQNWNTLKFEDKLKECIYCWFGSHQMSNDIVNEIIVYVGDAKLKHNKRLKEKMYRRDKSKRNVYLCLCCCK